MRSRTSVVLPKIWMFHSACQAGLPILPMSHQPKHKQNSKKLKSTHPEGPTPVLTPWTEFQAAFLTPGQSQFGRRKIDSGGRMADGMDRTEGGGGIFISENFVVTCHVLSVAQGRERVRGRLSLGDTDTDQTQTDRETG